MPNYILGKDCHAYYNTTLATANTNSSLVTTTQASTEITNIKDLTIELTTEKADISTRASSGWKNEVVVQKDGGVTFNMLWKPGDTAFTAFKTAYTGQTEIFFAAMDETSTLTGAQGLASNFNVTKFTRSEKLTEALMADIELSPSSYTNWITV